MGGFNLRIFQRSLPKVISRNASQAEAFREITPEKIGPFLRRIHSKTVGPDPLEPSESGTWLGASPFYGETFMAKTMFLALSELS